MLTVVISIMAFKVFKCLEHSICQTWVNHCLKVFSLNNQILTKYVSEFLIKIVTYSKLCKIFYMYFDSQLLLTKLRVESYYYFQITLTRILIKEKLHFIKFNSIVQNCFSLNRVQNYYIE